ncbi:MAG: hypothetical protein AAF790_02510 [Planctomycetota bacterium]
MTPEERLQITAIRGQALTQIEEVLAAPKPTYTLDGQSVRWQEYVESLRRSVDWCDQKLADDQPFEVQSHGGSSWR